MVHAGCGGAAYLAAGDVSRTDTWTERNDPPFFKVLVLLPPLALPIMLVLAVKCLPRKVVPI